tara:strand:+ start:225 stop:1892 length:1668 start_codon:yes stop_codon:yes gene_type:complete
MESANRHTTIDFKNTVSHIDDYLFGLAFLYSIPIKLARIINAIRVLRDSKDIASLDGLEPSGLQYFKFFAERSSVQGLRKLDRSTSGGVVWSRTTWPLSLITYRIGTYPYAAISLTLLTISLIYTSWTTGVSTGLSSTVIGNILLLAFILAVITSNSFFFQLLNLTWEILPWSLAIISAALAFNGHYIAAASITSIAVFFHPSIALFSLAGYAPIAANTQLWAEATTRIELITAGTLIGSSGIFMYSLLSNREIPGFAKQKSKRCRNEFLNQKETSLIKVAKEYLKLKIANRARNSNIIQFELYSLILLTATILADEITVYTAQWIALIICFAVFYALIDIYNRYNFFMSKYTLNTYGLFISLVIAMHSPTKQLAVVAIFNTIVLCNARFSGYSFLLDRKGGNLEPKPKFKSRADDAIVSLIKTNLVPSKNLLIFNIERPDKTIEILPRLCYFINKNIEGINFLLSPVNELIDPTILKILRTMKCKDLKEVINICRYFDQNEVTVLLAGKTTTLETIIPKKINKSITTIPLGRSNGCCIINLNLAKLAKKEEGYA